MGRGKRGQKEWTAAGAARSAREARIATMSFLRDAPIARSYQAAKLVESYQGKVLHLGQQYRNEAALLLFTGLGYPENWRPANWSEATERVLTDQARDLAAADLYILSPQMCDVVVAAAQSLTMDDLSLLAADDLPSLSGIVVLPHPLLVRAVNGNLGDDRAYQWQSPVSMPKPDPASRNGWQHAPSVRMSLYHDAHGPVRPDTFLELAAEARGQGTPLPPLLLDSIRCVPFETTVTDEQRQNHAKFVVATQQARARFQDRAQELGYNEENVTGEYTPGSEIHDADDTFTARFLYAFWRLCEQRIATTSQAETRHAATVNAERAGVSPEVRVVQLRQPTETTGDTNASDGYEWQHRWVVRMHKVRQWYPSEQRHKVIYRGPYIKGPANKPLLGGEIARGLVR